MWDSVCLLVGSGLPLKQQAIQLGSAVEHREETYCFWPHNHPFPLVWKACVDCTVKKIKGQKSPTVVTMPKKYKETNPDARIWGISSAMRLCPLTEGQRNIKGLTYFKVVSGYFLWPSHFMHAGDIHSLTFNKQNLFSSIQGKSWYRFQTWFIYISSALY